MWVVVQLVLQVLDTGHRGMDDLRAPEVHFFAVVDVARQHGSVRVHLDKADDRDHIQRAVFLHQPLSHVQYDLMAGASEPDHDTLRDPSQPGFVLRVSGRRRSHLPHCGRYSYFGF